MINSRANCLNTTSFYQKERDYIFLQYGIEQPDLPDHCDECGATFDIYHALDCKNRGLITACHNNISDGVVDLVSKAFNSTHVCDDLKKYTGHDVRRGKGKLKGSPSKE